MHNYLQNSLRNLTAVSNRTALHSLDEDRIKLHFRLLAKHGIPIDADAINAWLVGNGWPTDSAKKVTAWARTIADGGRVQIGNASFFSEEEEWRRIQDAQ